MTAENRGRAFSGDLLDRRDWVYVLALLVPFTVYTLVLKAARVGSLPGDPGLLGTFGLMRSDILFDLGYALFWIGLFAVARRGLPRLLVVWLFHATTITVALIETGAARFYEITGSSLDATTILFFLSSPKEVGTVVASAVTPSLVATLAIALLYAIFGPWLLSRFAARRWGRQTVEPGTPRASWLGFAGAALVAYALVSLSLLPGGKVPGASETSTRDGFLNVVLSAVESSPLPYVDAEKVRESLPTQTRLEPAERTRKRNVVLIFLESTRASSVTPYNEDIQTTPFLDELAGQSLFAERAYAAMPHTTNAQTATICGIDPPTREGTASLGDRIPARCLPDLLNEQGYRTAYFQSATENFERRPEVVKNMGYEEFYSLEDLDKKGFQRANYFGYEDDILLEPSRKWLQQNGDEPFFVTYNTITPHHQYLAPDKRYGRKQFAKDDTVNRYQNTVRYLDFFVKNLIRQYKEMGLYENTVFVILGDHGEAFGEHGRYQHDNVIWEEGLRIPMMVLDPSRPAGRIKAPVGELDVLPTVADALGYRVEGGEYPGRSMLDPLPEDRTLKFSCWYENKCLASVKGDKKYIYHFGDRPEEFYDLSKDPLEKNNIIDEVAPEEIKARREELLEWRARADTAYGSP